MIAGLTGGIATGKTAVAGFFKELGAQVIDFDELAHRVILPPSKTWQAIVEYFGREVLRPDGTINRAALGEVVFNDPQKLAALNRIVHPAVLEEDRRITREILAKSPGALVIKDVPLLADVSVPLNLEKIVVVFASPATQMKRMMERGFGPEAAQRRINAQAPLSEKIKIADYVINNDGTLEETRKQVAEIFEQLKKYEKGGA